MTAWHYDAITSGELDALRRTAERAWGDDTRYPLKQGDPRPHTGQSYVTAHWLTQRLGGYVGVSNGHYAWVSPDNHYVIDLTSGFYGENNGYVPCATATSNERTAKFAKRANIIFDSLDKLLKVSLDYMGDAYPAEEPQRASDIDQQYWDDEPNYEPMSGEYRFVYVNGTLEVSPGHDHKQLAEHAGIPADHQGPMAVGWVLVNNGKATWETQSNVNLKALERVFKDYGKNVGWEWGGLTNVEGEPVNDEFAPKSASHLRFAFIDDHLYLGRISHSELALQSSHPEDGAYGWLSITGQRATVWPVHIAAIPSLCEWAEDQGLILYAGNDNVIKTIEDLELDNTGANSGEMDTADEAEEVIEDRGPSGLYKCPSCARLFPRWQLYDRHRREGCGETNREPNQDGGFPEIGSDEPDPFKPHFTPMQPEVFPLASIKQAARVDGFLGGNDDDTYFVAYHYGCPIGYARLANGSIADLHCAKQEAKWPLLEKVARYAQKEPKDLISAPVPFIFDVEDDEITVGQQGQRTSDIPGKFTPGGIVEGTYEPGGKVIIRSMTTIPYTVRHMVELWYYQHPELSVKSVHLRDDAGKDTKLASADEIGQTMITVAQANPVVDHVSKLLFRNGGQVYAVGGAIRDLMMGKSPKDIDLMVTGLSGEQVTHLLENLDGEVDYTGRDFGVFRYKEDGEEVEIALPRKDRSTGDRHTDFDVQADHTMSPEEDLYRRDFTANAMAVNLNDGKLIDPYNGAADIENRRLRTLHNLSLDDDPLRVLRAVVAKARHGLDPDEATRNQMRNAAHRLRHLPPERVQAELDKLFAAEDPANAVRLAHETQVLAHVLPEVHEAFGYDQKNRHHHLDLGEHLVQTLENVASRSDDPDLRLAALLHDIGKPSAAWQDPETGDNHYYEKRMPAGETVGKMHEVEGSQMAKERLSELRYPEDRSARITELIRHHMFSPIHTERGARKFLRKVDPHDHDLLELRLADRNAKGVEYPGAMEEYDAQRKLIDQVRKKQQPTNRSHLSIDGNDIIGAGVPAGPMVGQILEHLTDAAVENPSINQRDQLLQMVQDYDKLQQP